MSTNNVAIIDAAAALEDAIIARLEPLVSDGHVKSIRVHTFFGVNDLLLLHQTYQHAEPVCILSTPQRQFEVNSAGSGMVCRLDYNALYSVAIITASRADDKARRQHLYAASGRLLELLPNVPFTDSAGQPSREFWEPRMTSDQHFVSTEIAAYFASFSVQARIAKTGVY